MPVAGNLSFVPLTHADAAFAAAAVTAVQPRRPKPIDQLKLLWTTTDQTADVRRFLVEAGGRRAGWLSIVRYHDDAEGYGHVDVLLPAAAAALHVAAYEFGLWQAQQMGVRTAVTEVWEEHPAVVAVLESAGWIRERQERFWRLELGPSATRIRAMRASSRERMAWSGVEVATMADLHGRFGPADLYEVNLATFADIPRTAPEPPEPLQIWLQWIQPPEVFEDRIWVAVVEGKLAGMSHLRFTPGLVETGFTGVLAAYRNRGIGRALKLETLGQAVELGVTAVETDNDAENGPILHLNEELGYQEVAGTIELHKRLAPG